MAVPAGDPESPLCSRLTISGSFLNVTDATESATAWAALKKAHPAMANWPSSHDFFVGKMEITQMWLINAFGGASIISAAEYFNQTMA